MIGCVILKLFLLIDHVYTVSIAGAMAKVLLPRCMGSMRDFLPSASFSSGFWGQVRDILYIYIIYRYIYFFHQGCLGKSEQFCPPGQYPGPSAAWCGYVLLSWKDSSESKGLTL